MLAVIEITIIATAIKISRMEISFFICISFKSVLNDYRLAHCTFPNPLFSRCNLLTYHFQVVHFDNLCEIRQSGCSGSSNNGFVDLCKPSLSWPKMIIN